MLWPLFYALFYLATESETVDESKKSGDPDKLKQKMVGNNCDQTDESFDAFSKILFQYDLGYPGHNNLMNYAEDFPRHNQQPPKIAGYANLTNQSTEANACPPKPPTIITTANLPPKPPTIITNANLPPKPPTKANLPPKPPTKANLPPKPYTIKTNTFVDRSKRHANFTNQSIKANLPPKPPAIKTNTFVDRSKGHGTNHFAENRKITIKIKGNSNSSLKIDKSAKLKSNDENLPKNQIHLKTKFKNLSVLSGTSNTGTVSLPANDPSQSDGSDQQQQEDSSDGDVSMFEAQNSSEDSDTYSSDLAAASQPTPAAINTSQSDGSDQQQQEDSSDGDVSMFEAQNSSEDSDTYSSDLAAASQPTPAAINTIKKPSARQQKLMKQYVEMKNTGATDVQIAAQFNIHKNTLASWKKKHGFELKSQFDDDEKEQMLEEYFKLKKKFPKLSDKNIAEDCLNISRSALMKWKTRQGIKRKSSSSSSFDAKSADHSAADDDEDDASGESGIEMAQKMPTNKNAQTDGRRQTRDGISSASGTKNFENTEKGAFGGNAGNHKRSSY
uniref:HTH psq-type domain-containing protein n=1 Tax=Globodera pallida TaxID=36090 RepID=A0A183BRF4_GLOPA